MSNIEKDMNIIYKIVWSYVKAYPWLEFEDLVSEACIIYLENIDLYDESKGSQSTFICHIVRNHINTLLSKKQENLIENEVLDTFFSNEKNPEQILMEKESWEELFENLSPKAKEICNIVFNNNVYLPIDTPRKCRGIIIQELRKNNWSWCGIWNTFRELKHI